jgi:16S rRNA (uracil1498-N3)-methyltransferase
MLQCLIAFYSVIDMRLHRFYVSQPLGEEVVIQDVSIIKQWANVFRYAKGDLVVLFNGEGQDVTYSLFSISSKQAELKKESEKLSYTSSRKVTLYLSIIKKDAFELVVQKVSELGVTDLVPIISERTIKKDLNEERLKKIAIESAEQCGRGYILNLHPVTTLENALLKGRGSTFYLHAEGESAENAKEAITAAKELSFFIGSEGGWSDNDLLLFNNASIPSFSLGKLVLRAETAAIVAAFIPQLY